MRRNVLLLLCLAGAALVPVGQACATCCACHMLSGASACSDTYVDEAECADECAAGGWDYYEWNAAGVCFYDGLQWTCAQGVEVEACCLPDGTCTNVDSAVCADMGGVPQGFGTVCSGFTEACCLQDGSCVDVDPLCCDDLGGTPGAVSPCGPDSCDNPEQEMKWEQPPDLFETGIDVHATYPYVLADDFECRSTGPITQIEVYGSWLNDIYPMGDPGAVTFRLSFHFDIPADPPLIPYSRPQDPPLWFREFLPGSFTVEPVDLMGAYEGWMEPPDQWIPQGDTNCFKYTFRLDDGEFIQEGTPEVPLVYWLDVQAVPGVAGAVFGWKTSRAHWNDDAVWATGLDDGSVAPMPWIDLIYPPGHPMNPDSIDQAFAIYGRKDPLLGACCLPDGSCITTTAADCALQLGTYQGDGTFCSGTEACCLPSGACRDMDALCCVNVYGGTPQGAGSVCTGATEACCLSDGTCMDLDPLCCDDMGGTPQGVGTACTGVTIACCFSDGSCQDLEAQCCDDMGGYPSPSGAAACLGDVSPPDGIDDACALPEKDIKWEQPPDLMTTGIDIAATEPFVLADDFLCTSPGPITRIVVYGSWLNDYLPGGEDPLAVEFRLSFHADIPDPDGNGPLFSMPLQPPLWYHVFAPGTFTAEPIPVADFEGWMEPPSEWIPNGDTICWKYTFALPADLAFIQEGTPSAPIVYWLDVQAMPLDASALFGWKTSTNHWNDDAVWALGLDDGSTILTWQELIYPLGHDFAGDSIDLAFELWGKPVEFVGACCLSDGTCVVTDQANCEAILGGNYQGDGTVCEGVQACCLPDGTCTDVDAICCRNDLGGTPQGAFSACSAATEACCLSDGTCQDVDPLCCDDLGGVAQGAGTACSGATVACCLPDGTCTDVDPLCCDDLGGSPGYAAMCLGDNDGNGTDDACELPEACCMTDGSCADMLPGACTLAGGTPQGFGTACSGTTIACCLTDGSCTDVDPLCCDDLGGTTGYAPACLGDNDGNGTDDACEEAEACCMPDGSCSNMLPGACATAGGTAQGAGTLCSGVTEGCCLSDGTCMDVDPLCCDDLGGVAQGAGTACTGMTLACCFHDGSCQDLDPLCCDDLGGVVGLASACLGDNDGSGTDDACEEFAACCMPDGSCADMSAAGCMLAGGAPQGSGTACSAATEACCLPDGTCMDVDPLCCDDLGGTTQGSGSACTGVTLPCCFGDGSCMDLDPLCCDDLGGTPSPTGAMACLGDGDGNGVDDACELPMKEPKWMQMPDLDITGIDIHATYPYVVADDFECRSTGPITRVVVYGSWLDDVLPFGDPPFIIGDPLAVTFRLSFHADIPVDPPMIPYSRPEDPPLWFREFPPATFTVEEIPVADYEGWMEPPEEWIPVGDTICWKYTFEILEDPFVQMGTEELPLVYWLDVQAVSEDGVALFGWKTTRDHWNDDSVWATGIDDGSSFMAWQELHYPPGHPFYPDSLDQAFEIWGYPEGPTEGACCMPDGSCMISDPANCLAMGGTYEGDGTTCLGMEACCQTDGTCVDADALCCTNHMGTPQGPGTVCTAVEACCMPDGTCMDVDPICCDDLGGIPQGVGTACTAVEACCLSDDTCIDVDPLCCDDLGGVPQGVGTVCTSVEACCLPGGLCEMMDPLCCADQGGTPHVGETCSAPRGCCRPDGSCIEMDPLCCSDMGWTPQDPGEHCTMDQACCMPDGSCEDMDPLCCIDQGGTPDPTGTCTTDQACCMPDDTCEMLDPLCCALEGGTTVVGGVCSKPHACCLPDGTCEMLDPACCTSQGGVDLVGDTCDDVEACCLPDGTCEMLDPLCCDVEGGTVHVGETCSAPRACCRPDDSCVELDPICCLDAGYTPQDPGDYCTSIEACCLPDGSCDMMDPTCCEDQGGTALVGDTCTSEEACCLPDGSCMLLDPLCCSDEGGTPQGTGTTCSGIMVACCLPDGSCMDVDETCCDDLGGTSSIYSSVCLGDTNGDMIDDACAPPDIKWHQPPDLTPTGIDVNASINFPYLLADDFECNVTGPITKIDIFTSWRHDHLPNGAEWEWSAGDPTAVSFTLSIHEDIPDPDGAGPLYSMPVDPPLWVKTFLPGQFSVEPVALDIDEGWLDAPEFYEFPGDHVCWKYTFELDPGEFVQQGTELEPIVYWLDMQASPVDAETRLGWKTSLEHWNDDAVWSVATEPTTPSTIWNELRYPPVHPLHPQSIDLAFTIYGGDEPPVPCMEHVDCVLHYDDCCNWDHCGSVTPGYCDPPIPMMFGDIAGTTVGSAPNGAVNLTDITCVLDAFGLGNLHMCPNADVTLVTTSDCPHGNGVVNLTDILKVLDAFGAPSSPTALFFCDCPLNP